MSGSKSEEKDGVNWSLTTSIFLLAVSRQCFFLGSCFNFVAWFSLPCCVVCCLDYFGHLLGKSWPLNSLVCNVFVCFVTFSHGVLGFGTCVVLDWINSRSLCTTYFIVGLFLKRCGTQLDCSCTSQWMKFTDRFKARERCGSVVECSIETERPRVWAISSSLRCGPWARHIYPCLVLVQPRKTSPCLTERLLMWSKNQIKQNKCFKAMLLFKIIFVIYVLCLSCILTSSLQSCGHLLWKGLPLGFLVCDVILCFSTSHVVSLVRCGTWLYPFLIFVSLLTLKTKRPIIWKYLVPKHIYATNNIWTHFSRNRRI